MVMWVKNGAVSLWRHKLTIKNIKITTMLMQDTFSERQIYIPCIAYNKTLLFLRENNIYLYLKLAILFRHVTRLIKWWPP